MTDFDQQHSDIAWGHWTAQFANSPRLESLVKALYAPADQFPLKQLLEERWLDAAVGAQLDGIGQIVGLPRYVQNAFNVIFFGYTEQTDIDGFDDARIRREGEQQAQIDYRLHDAEYRRLLYWKIAVNNGHGTAPEIAAAVKLVFDSDSVAITQDGEANFKLWFNRTSSTLDALLTDIEKWIPRAAGVGMSVSSTPSGKTFGFANMGFYGFGEGVMASSL